MARAYYNRLPVTRVIDGDTIGVEVKVRIANYKAPELDEPGGPEALKALQTLITMCGHKVEVWEGVGQATYGRMAAMLTDPKLGDLGALLHKEGFLEPASIEGGIDDEGGQVT